jgi:hypothetical protein
MGGTMSDLLVEHPAFGEPIPGAVITTDAHGGPVVQWGDLRMDGVEFDAYGPEDPVDWTMVRERVSRWLDLRDLDRVIQAADDLRAEFGFDDDEQAALDRVKMWRDAVRARGLSGATHL